MNKQLAVLALLLFSVFIVSSVHVGWATTYNYVFQGPYLETGTWTYNGTVYLLITFENNGTYAYILHGNGVLTATTINITSATPATSMFWNITSDWTKQREYTFEPDETGTYFIYVPADTDVVEQYLISVASFTAVTNAYASTLRTINGAVKTIEKMPLDILSNMPFFLILYSQYQLQVVSDEGNWTWSLPADTVQTKSFLITKDMVSANNTSLNCTVSAVRTDSRTIVTSYLDQANTTTTVTSTVTDANTGSVVDNETGLGNMQTFTYADADPLCSYTVSVTATQNGEQKFWSFMVGPYQNTYDPLTGLYFPASTISVLGAFAWTGSAAAIVTNALGMFIVLLVFAVGEWRDVELFSLFAVIVAFFLMVIQFLAIPVAGGAMAFVVVAVMFLHKAKQTEREV